VKLPVALEEGVARRRVGPHPFEDGVQVLDVPVVAVSSCVGEFLEGVAQRQDGYRADPPARSS
jgi:hypothetical protein